MLRTSLFITVIILASMVSLNAQGRGFGLGIVLGEPTGIAGKAWTSGSTAVSFGLGYSFTGSDSRVNLHVDYLFHSFNQIKAPEKFVLFYGVGARLKSAEHSDNSLGVRGVVGIDWFIHNAPVDIFFEVAPVMKLIPNTGVDIDAGLGVRYFF